MTIMHFSNACQTCRIIRMFLAVAGLLVGLIWLQPGGLVTLAGFFPSTQVIVALMMSVGTAGFVSRYLRYTRARRTTGA